MSRPVTRKVNLKDGFYIDVGGIKIHRATKKEIDIALKRYKKSHNATFLGEVKNGKFI